MVVHIQETQVIDEGTPVETTYDLQTNTKTPNQVAAMGLPVGQRIAYHDRYNTVDTLQMSYIGRDTFQLAVVGGTRTNRFG